MLLPPRQGLDAIEASSRGPSWPGRAGGGWERCAWYLRRPHVSGRGVGTKGLISGVVHLVPAVALALLVLKREEAAHPRLSDRSRWTRLRDQSRPTGVRV